jgi:hypothetical protein
MKRDSARRVAMHFWGDFALWTIPMTDSDPSSQCVPSASAIEGMHYKIHTKPQFRFVVEDVFIRHPFVYSSVKNNEFKEISHIQPQQRCKRLLMHPDFVTISRIELIEENIDESRRADCTVDKYFAMFMENAKTGTAEKGMPCFGCSDYGAFFRVLELDEARELTGGQTLDLGWLYYGIDRLRPSIPPVYFDAKMVDGWIDYEGAKKEVSLCR